MSEKRFSETALSQVREKHSVSSVFEQYGARLRKAGREYVCLCPFHSEKSGSCTIDDAKGFFYCFGCGAAGDVIDAVMRFQSCDFIEAVNSLGGELEVSDEDRQRIEERRREQADKDRKERERSRNLVERHFEAGRPIAGTHAAAYLKARGLTVTPGWTFDLRFAPELTYYGYADRDAESAQDLGRFPAMLAAIRDVQGDIIGLHRTYLDKTAPRKLTPPGDPKRNAAKKVLGEMAGGMIRLSTMMPHLVLGEGIETSRSWFVMGISSGDVAVASAVSLGNLSGGCTGTFPHPRFPKDKHRTIPNGIPDPDRPGVILPDIVEEVTLIGDGDSDPAMTRARLLAAARRFREQGKTVTISMAADGFDFNDHLLADDPDAEAAA